MTHSSPPPFTKHRARKRFGQNFLRDQFVIDRIVNAIALKHDDHVVEIGPGEGALTQRLVHKAGRLDAIELDRDLVPWIKVQFDNYKNFVVHEADALKFDFAKLLVGTDSGHKVRLVGNLPYNISTPLMFHALKYASHIRDMHFMLQKEVVQRLVAAPDSRHYGRLGIMVQYFCKTEALFDVSPEAFDPPPKVTSAIVRLTPHEVLPVSCKDVEALSYVVTTAFSARRKAVRNSLKTIVSEETLRSVGVDPGLRPQNLSIEDYANITEAYLLEKN